MRSFLLATAILFSGCYFGEEPVGEEVCDGVDNDGDGCVDITIHEDLEIGIYFESYLIEDCPDGGISICIDGEMTPCEAGQPYLADVETSCETGPVRAPAP